MNKNHFMVLGVSVLVMLTIAIIVFMLMLPKQSSAIKGTIKPYEQIQKTEYTFEATRDITSEPLKKQYAVSSEDMNGFKNASKYITGNTDPFAKSSSSSSSGSGSSSSGSSSSNSGTRTPTASGTTEEATKEATNKTTNSNGGTPNPASTGK